MARRYTRSFNGHRVTVVIHRDNVTIEDTWIDPDEGEINAVGHASLSKSELSWVVGKVLAG